MMTMLLPTDSGVVAHVKVGLEMGSHTPAVFNTVVRYILCQQSTVLLLLQAIYEARQNLEGVTKL